jgi:hypothetical protein
LEKKKKILSCFIPAVLSQHITISTNILIILIGIKGVFPTLPAVKLCEQACSYLQKEVLLVCQCFIYFFSQNVSIV